MIGRLIERLFVQVRADLSQMSTELQDGVRQTRAATGQMASQWATVEKSIQSLTREFGRGKVTQGDYLRQLNQHVKSMSQVGMEYRDAQKQVHGFAAALVQAARAQAVVTNVVPIQKYNRSLGQSRMQMMNLGYQLNDIGMTLATGMNPLTVMIQQGSQILQIYAGQGGVTAAIGDLSKMILGIGKRLWPLIALAGAFGLLQREINKTTDVTVSFMDTTKAVFQVLWGRIKPFIDGPMSWLKQAFEVVADFIVEYFPPVMDGMINGMRIMVRSVEILVSAIPDIFKGAWFGAKREVFWALADILGGVADMVDSVTGALNGAFGTNLTATSGIRDMQSELNKMGSDAAVAGQGLSTLADAWAEIKAESDRIWGESLVGDFFDDVRAQAIQNALQRMAKDAGDVGGAAAEAAEEVKSLLETLDEGLTSAADNLAGVFGSAFESLAETGKLTFSSFIQDLNQLIIKSTSELLQDELSNMFKTLATSQGGLGSMFSNLFTGLFGGGNMFNLGKRARGGVEMPWRNFIAGEEGAELINQDGPAGARRVATAGRTRHMMQQGGMGSQVNMYIQTPDAESFQKSQGQIASRMNGFLARGQRNQ